MNSIAWAAGFMEGEATFHFGSNLNVKAVQVQREPLERLQRLFGGTITARNGKGIRQDHFVWQTWGSKAAAAAMTVFSMMSTRRKGQITTALSKWRFAPGRLGGRLHKNYRGGKE